MIYLYLLDDCILHGNPFKFWKSKKRQLWKLSGLLYSILVENWIVVNCEDCTGSPYPCKCFGIWTVEVTEIITYKYAPVYSPIWGRNWTQYEVGEPNEAWCQTVWKSHGKPCVKWGCLSAFVLPPIDTLWHSCLLSFQAHYIIWFNCRLCRLINIVSKQWHPDANPSRVVSYPSSSSCGWFR